MYINYKLDIYIQYKKNKHCSTFYKTVAKPVLLYGSETGLYQKKFKIKQK